MLRQLLFCSFISPEISGHVNYVQSYHFSQYLGIWPVLGGGGGGGGGLGQYLGGGDFGDLASFWGELASIWRILIGFNRK